MPKLSLLVLNFILLNTALADEWVYIKPEIGLGYSDNVYQDDLYKKEDFFTWLKTMAKYELSDSNLTAAVNLNLYSKESANNSVDYLLKRKSELDYGNLDLTLGLGGFSYFQSDVASTDESFNHFYFTGYLTKKVLSDKNLDLFIEPGAKVSSYPQLSNRSDLTAFTRLDLAWQYSRNTVVYPYLELAYLFSSQSYYTKNYVDLGVEWDQKINEIYKFSLDLFLRSSAYPNRKVSDILFLPNPRRRGTVVNVSSYETTRLSQMIATFSKVSHNNEISFSINYATQSSLSQLDYFTEIQLLASTLWIF